MRQHTGWVLNRLGSEPVGCQAFLCGRYLSACRCVLQPISATRPPLMRVPKQPAFDFISERLQQLDNPRQQPFRSDGN